MNNLSEKVSHDKLVIQMFQTLFPSINIKTVKVQRIRRCVILHKNLETGLIEFRHYGVMLNPSGVSEGLRNFAQYKVPNMHALKDISEFIIDESAQQRRILGFDDDNKTLKKEVVIPACCASVKLFEVMSPLPQLGPRMSLKLEKIHKGINDDEILYHCRVSKTDVEKKELRKRHEARLKLKQHRKMEQEENVKRKQTKTDKKLLKSKLRRSEHRQEVDSVSKSSPNAKSHINKERIPS